MEGDFVSEEIKHKVDDLAIDYAQDVAKGAVMVEDSKVRAVKLFGSHARGESSSNSDVDVLVVWDGLQPNQREEVSGKIRDKMSDLDSPLDTGHLQLLVVSPEEFENPDPVKASYLVDIKKNPTVDIDLPEIAATS